MSNVTPIRPDAPEQPSADMQRLLQDIDSANTASSCATNALEGIEDDLSALNAQPDRERLYPMLWLIREKLRESEITIERALTELMRLAGKERDTAVD